jgi:hypothetical protein
MRKPKQFVLTIDYELFFGEKYGTVDSCQIEPTNLLANLLSKYDSRMTVFWDILHYWKLKELSCKYPNLAEEAAKIEEQILQLAKNHHDIQLHLHPHWINTTFNGKDWQFNLDGYRLQHLSQMNNPKDINTIAGCVKIGKNLIEETVKMIIPDHKVNTFRAGGFGIQPFEKLAQVFLTNGLLIDSSVCYGLKLNKGEHSYDFTLIPRTDYYKFDIAIENEEPEGKFLEFPIGSIKVSPFRILWWSFIRRLKYKNLKTIGAISSSERHAKSVNARKSMLLQNIRKYGGMFLKDNYIMLTPDNSFREKFDYLINHAKNGTVMILHPKYLNYHTLNLLENYLKSSHIRFISLHDKINKNI